MEEAGVAEVPAGGFDGGGAGAVCEGGELEGGEGGLQEVEVGFDGVVAEVGGLAEGAQVEGAAGVGGEGVDELVEGVWVAHAGEDGGVLIQEIDFGGAAKVWEIRSMSVYPNEIMAVTEGELAARRGLGMVMLLLYAGTMGAAVAPVVLLP